MGKFLNIVVGLLLYTNTVNAQTPIKTVEGDFDGDKKIETASVIKDDISYRIDITNNLPSIKSLAPCDSLGVIKGDSLDHILYIFDIKNKNGFKFTYNSKEGIWYRDSNLK